MNCIHLSDYNSGQPTNWPNQQPGALNTKSLSYLDLVKGKCTLDDVMREFQMNGSDSPYNPDEDNIWEMQPGELPLSGFGPSGAYLRQKSWPEPERSPAQRLPRPRSMYAAWNNDFCTSTPVNGAVQHSTDTPKHSMTREQSRVLNSLPDNVLYSLLREMTARRRNLPLECRFCKNNGERESYYRSHALKASSGRVECPVLRALVCTRCGASGDTAHTIKYCPLSTNEERIKSTAMMNSVRMASGRRRHSYAPSHVPVADYVMFGEPTPSIVTDAANANSQPPLDHKWAALEQKLIRKFLPVMTQIESSRIM